MVSYHASADVLRDRMYLWPVCARHEFRPSRNVIPLNRGRDVSHRQRFALQYDPAGSAAPRERVVAGRLQLHGYGRLNNETKGEGYLCDKSSRA